MDELAAVVLAAGSGTRLRPLTDVRPKALCPVNNKALVDHAIERARQLTSSIAVNAWHHSDQLTRHLRGQVHLSVEAEPLGTAGGVANLRSWIDGRAVLLQNADAWHQADMTRLLDGWDGERVRLLVRHEPEHGDFGEYAFCGVSLQPWSIVQTFRAEPSGLYECSWRQLYLDGTLDFVLHDSPYFDCGTPPDYLAANLTAAGTDNVVGPSAVVEGTIDRCVVWPGAHVEADEDLVEVIRAPGGITVDASSPFARRR